MMRLIGLFFALMALMPLLNSASALPLEQTAIGAKTVRDDVFPRPPVPFADGVVAYPDVEYSNLIGYRPLLLDIYLPRKSKAPRPLVVWIHGGGWSRGDSRTSGAIVDFPATLAALAARGYVVASVNYRLSGEARFPAQIQDVKAAIQFLRANAGKYNIDPARALVWGGSAGGHLAALAATTCGMAEFAPEPNTGRLTRAEALAAAKAPAGSNCVQAAVIWYGIFDVARLPSPNVGSMMACDIKACEAEMAKASPITHVTAATPPMLLVHGLADTEVPVTQSQQMAARMKQAGAPVETLFIPDADHGLIGKTPQASRAATLQALHRTFDYIDAFFAKK